MSPQRTVRPSQPADNESSILEELRRLVQQMKGRFMQIVRLSRAQEQDLQEMRQAFKKHKRSR